MSHILAVFGATGQQGSAVINYILNDPEFSQKFKIRAITRDVSSEKAQQLDARVKVVRGDVTDRSSLESALSGVHTVFAMTTPDFGPDSVETEFQYGKLIADVAVEQHVEHIIFSTLPSVVGISGGKYTKVTPFDAKAKVEEYIRTLSIKSSFYCPGSFMQNYFSQPFVLPQKSADGTYVMSLNISPKAKFPLIDAVGDGGKFVGAMLADPAKFEGKRVCAATRAYTLEEICAIMAKVTGRTVVYKQISAEEFRAGLPFVPDLWIEGYNFNEEFGYFGPGQEELISWAAENARGRLSTLEEFLEAQSFQLS